jgi:hypothetical protein
MLEITGNMGQSKSEYRDFKKAKERTWDSASLRTKTFKSYTNAVFRQGCCCLSGYLSTKILREHGTVQV